MWGLMEREELRVNVGTIHHDGEDREGENWGEEMSR